MVMEVGLIQLLILIEFLCLRGVWLDVDATMDSKTTCVSKRLGLHAQNVLTNLGLIVKIINGGHLYAYSRRKIIFTLAMNKIFIRVPKIRRKIGYGLDLDFLTIL
jgi:hypothetical protein